LSIKEALAILENTEYTPVQEQLWEKVNKCKVALLGDASVFAAKVAAAATVFAIFSESCLKSCHQSLTGPPSVFAETTRQWFIHYGLTSGLITVVVALAPTLGMWYWLSTWIINLRRCFRAKFHDFRPANLGLRLRYIGRLGYPGNVS
jgi:hypothetical protein